MSIELKKVEARQFRKVLSSGRTSPCLFECEDLLTSSKEEYVVKLKQSLERKDRGLICEVISSIVAQFLELKTPPIALVNIDDEFCSVFEGSTMENIIASSRGLNFGSKFFTGGYSILPAGYPVSTSLEQAATEIIAFDGSIQNPDRRVNKPNMFIKGDEIFIFDHELAFSFLELIGKIDNPWEQSAFSSCLRGHFFYRQLKGKSLALERFTQKIKSMDNNFILSIRSAMPKEWNDDKVDDILNHLSKIVEYADKFIESVRREMI